MKNLLANIQNRINISDLLWASAVIGIWRILVEVYAIFALHRFPLTDTISQKFYFLTIWYNYDGHHYVGIAQKGYEYIQYAFFPLFPLAIKLVSWPATIIFGDKLSIYLVAGLLVTTISLIGAVYFLLQIAKHYFDSETGKRATFLLLFFPSAIFLAAIYTESFFLFWVTGSFYFGLQRNWLLAGILGAAAAATRSLGIIMFACLAIEFWLAYKNQWHQHRKDLMWLILIPLSLATYMIYQWVVVGNPLHFIEVQKAWGREVDISVFESLWRDYARGFNVLDFNETRIAPLYDGIATIFGVALAAVLTWKRMWSFAIFTLGATLLSLTSGTTVGAIRYVIVAFPAFLLLGHWGRHHIIYSFLLAGFTIFFSLLSIHFLNTWWLA